MQDVFRWEELLRAKLKRPDFLRMFKMRLWGVSEKDMPQGLRDEFNDILAEALDYRVYEEAVGSK